MRIWLACAGALLVMAVIIYLVIGRERGESGLRLEGGSRSVAALAAGVPAAS